MRKKRYRRVGSGLLRDYRKGQNNRRETQHVCQKGVFFHSGWRLSDIYTHLIHFRPNSGSGGRWKDCYFPIVQDLQAFIKQIRPGSDVAIK